MTVAVAVLADESYLDKAKQVLYGAHVLGNWPGEYILLTDVTDPAPLAWFRERGVTVIQPQLDELYGAEGLWSVLWPSTVLAKLWLFHPSMRRWDTVVFLDLDILIRRDIRGLLRYRRFAARTETHTLGDQFHLPQDLTVAEAIARRAELERDFDLNSRSFNSGVMVVPTRSNNQDFYDRMIALAERFAGISKYAEQGLINLAFARDARTWASLPMVYNHIYCGEVNEYDGHTLTDHALQPEPVLVPRMSAQDTVILHFTGPYKPWRRESPFHHEWTANAAGADGLFAVSQRGKPSPRHRERLVQVKRLLHAAHYVLRHRMLRRSLLRKFKAFLASAQARGARAWLRR